MPVRRGITKKSNLLQITKEVRYKLAVGSVSLYYFLYDF